MTVSNVCKSSLCHTPQSLRDSSPVSGEQLSNIYRTLVIANKRYTTGFKGITTQIMNNEGNRLKIQPVALICGKRGNLCIPLLKATITDFQIVTFLIIAVFGRFFAYYRPYIVPARRPFNSLIDC